MLCNRHHRNWFVGGQPVGLVVSARVVAHVVKVAEKERHCVELCHTRTSTSLVFKIDFYHVILSTYQGPDGGTSRCPRCRGESIRPTSLFPRARTRGSRKTGCALPACGPFDKPGWLYTPIRPNLGCLVHQGYPEMKVGVLVFSINNF